VYKEAARPILSNVGPLYGFDLAFSYMGSIFCDNSPQSALPLREEKFFA
jgi:hypothetical protein